MIIVGGSGSDKSVLFAQMLLQKGFIDCNNLYYYSKTYKSQPEMKNIIEGFKKIYMKKILMWFYVTHSPFSWG